MSKQSRQRIKKAIESAKVPKTYQVDEVPLSKIILQDSTAMVASFIPDHASLIQKYDIESVDEQASSFIQQVQHEGRLSLALLDFIGLTKPSFAEIIEVDIRTLNRMLSESRQLKRHQVESITFMIAAMEKVRDYLSDEEKVQRWMHRPNAALNGTKPVHLLKTISGCQALIDFTGQLQHGVMI